MIWLVLDGDGCPVMAFESKVDAEYWLKIYGGSTMTLIDVEYRADQNLRLMRLQEAY